jgi:cytochrome c556
MVRMKLFAVLALGVATALPAVAQFQRPEQAVVYRKAAFQVMQAHFGRIGQMVNGRVPYDAAAAAANAEVVAFMSKLPYAGFVEGTAGKGEKYSAKPNIWTERAKFDAAAKKMQDEAAKMAVVAKANNLDQLKAAFGATAASCKACHDDFQVQ